MLGLQPLSLSAASKGSSPWEKSKHWVRVLVSQRTGHCRPVGPQCWPWGHLACSILSMEEGHCHSHNHHSEHNHPKHRYCYKVWNWGMFWVNDVMYFPEDYLFLCNIFPESFGDVKYFDDVIYFIAFIGFVSSWSNGFFVSREMLVNIFFFFFFFTLAAKCAGGIMFSGFLSRCACVRPPMYAQ